MLKFIFTDTEDTKVLLFCPLALSINQEENIPCDDMTAVFSYEKVPQLKSVVVYDDDAVVFTGVVDEQQTIISTDGAYLKICARSMAAALIDNESIPVTYNHPNANLIFEKHAKPFGISKYNGNDSTYYGELVISKGMSNWQAVYNFFSNCFSKTPRINIRGELDFLSPYGDKIVFSANDGDINYISLTQTQKRCEEISRVNIKVTNSSGYFCKVTNEDAEKRGITRERYLNAVLTDTPMKCADMMISNGRKNSFNIKLICQGRYLDILGRSAKVKSDFCSDEENLYVSEVRYVLNSKKDLTTIVLKRKDA